MREGHGAGDIEVEKKLSAALSLEVVAYGAFEVVFAIVRLVGYAGI